MLAAIMYGNVLTINREIMTIKTPDFAEILRDAKTLIHTTLSNSWDASRLANPDARVTPPSLWILFLGERKRVIQHWLPDSEKEIFRHRLDITEPYREFWDIVQNLGYVPEVRCASLCDKTGAFLLLREAKEV